MKGEKLLDELTAGISLRSTSQAIHALDSLELVGYELLARGPIGPLEMPLNLFSFAAENNALTKLDMACLKVAVLAGAALLETNPDLRLHINLFPQTIVSEPLETIAEVLEPISGSSLCIEIVESRDMPDIGELSRNMTLLRESGTTVAVDDVGCGYSSVEALLLLGPEVIKIDRSYVTGAASDMERAIALERLIDVGRALKSIFVAEGVDTDSDLAICRELGIEFGQGRLWSHIP